jgi:serine/threonine-protein kinase
MRYISHYKIIEQIGQGGMGRVFRAVDLISKQTVALKILSNELVGDPENRKRLSTEGHILSSFNHPNIVKVFEIGETEESGFIAMEYLSGGTLKKYLDTHHPLSFEKIKFFITQVGEGLAEIHAHQIIHRDIKTSNVMLDEQGQVRIMDFGLSKSPLASTMTQLGTVMGTLGYVSPEQITGARTDERTDIFSFGVVMYELVTGLLPFKGDNEIALIHSIFNDDPIPPREYVPDCPIKFQTIILRCLKKDPQQRYQHMDEVISDLKNLQ